MERDSAEGGDVDDLKLVDSVRHGRTRRKKSEGASRANGRIRNLPVRRNSLRHASQERDRVRKTEIISFGYF